MSGRPSTTRTDEERAYFANRYIDRKCAAFGLTREEYELRQALGCEVCGRLNADGSRLHIDHDHETGAFRGLLCSNCNLALGHAGDTPERLRQLAEYLEMH